MTDDTDLAPALSVAAEYLRSCLRADRAGVDAAHLWVLDGLASADDVLGRAADYGAAMGVLAFCLAVDVGRDDPGDAAAAVDRAHRRALRTLT
jgi:hypothetical protein